MFRKACQTHTKILRDHHAALLLPGSGSNLSRQQLNTNLQIILTSDVSNQERLSIAKTSLLYSEDLQNQINNITKKTALLKTSVKELKQFSEIFYLQKGLLLSIETAIEKTGMYIERTQHTQKILSLMNKQSKDIFARIIEEKGSLSVEHINKLNEDIPFAEQNFDSLTEFYKDISKLQKEIHTSCNSFVLDTTTN